MDNALNASTQVQVVLHTYGLDNLVNVNHVTLDTPTKKNFYNAAKL